MSKISRFKLAYRDAVILITMSLIMIFFWGCRRNEESVLLNQAESISIENPDSALKLLSKIKIDRLSNKQKADYILYREKANYYSGNSSESDSVLKKAIEYYSKNSSKYKKELAECLYYQGHIQSSHGNPGLAIVCFIKSNDIYKALRDTLMMALCYRGLGDTYGDIQSKSQALQNYKESYFLFNKIKSDKYTPFAYYDLARAYYNNFDYNRSISVTDSVIDRYQNTEVASIPYFIADCINLKIADFYGLRKFNEVISLYEAYDDKKAILRDTLSVAAIGIGYYRLGRYKDLEDFSKIAPDNFWVTMVLEDSRGNLKKVNELVVKQSDDQNKVMKRFVAGDYQQIVADYYDTSIKLEQTQKAIQKERFLILLLIFIVLFIVVIAVFVFRSRNLKLEILRNKNALLNTEGILRNMQVKDSMRKYELSKTREELTKLNSLIDEVAVYKNNEASNVQRVIKLYRKRFGLISQIGESNFQSKDEESASKIILKKIKLLFDYVVEDPKFLNEIEKEIDECFGNAVSILKNRIPRLKDEDIRFYIFLILGFTTDALAGCFHEKKETIYNRKRSLKNKIAKYCGDDASRLLSYIR